MNTVKEIIKRLNESSQPEVGIFFKIRKKIYGWGEPIRDIESVGGFKDLDMMHSDYFDDLTYISELGIKSSYEYTWYPRGRVIYRESDSKFIVYMDKCLFNPEDKSAIAREFKLPLSRTEWLTDEHYICAGCDDELKSEMSSELFSECLNR